MKLFCVLFLFAVQASAQEVWTLNQFLDKATSQTESFQALDKSLQSLQAEIASRDLDLSSTLKIEGWKIQDRKDSFTNSIDRRNDSDLLGLTLAKPFATGTTLSLATAGERADQNTFTSDQYRSDWELSLSQDLWRNGFGRQTYLRRQSDQAELESRKLDLLLQRQQLLNRLESAYWDLALVLKQRNIADENLKRSQQILDWTQKRVRLSAALDTDLLQAQALVSTRQLELSDINRSFESTWALLQELVPAMTPQSFSPLSSELEKERDPHSLLSGQNAGSDPNPTLIEVLSSRYKTEQLLTESQAVRDDLNPSLQLQLAHGKNGIRSSADEAVQRSLDGQATDTRVGLVFSMDLDFTLKRQRQLAAELKAQASELEHRRLQKASDVSWKDYLAQIDYLKKSLELSRKLFDFQNKRIARQRVYFQRGKNTVFEFISSEVEVSAAELRFFNLLNQLRKAEAQARLYTFGEKASLP